MISNTGSVPDQKY